jgi:hypothetical protein
VTHIGAVCDGTGVGVDNVVLVAARRVIENEAGAGVAIDNVPDILVIVPLTTVMPELVDALMPPVLVPPVPIIEKPFRLIVTLLTPLLTRIAEALENPKPRLAPRK